MYYLFALGDHFLNNSKELKTSESLNENISSRVNIRNNN